MSESSKPARAKLLSRSTLAIAAIMAFSPLLNSLSARAESSDALEFQAKRKAQRSGQSYARPQKANSQPNYTPQAQGKATTVTEVVADRAVQPFLAASASADMAAAESRYAQIVAAGGWPSVPRGSYKKGTQNAATENLNKRLFIEGYLRAEAAQGEFASVYTSATQDAVTRFQRNMGLASTGAVDGPTLAALNVTAQARLATLRANLPRVALYSQELGDRYVVVNIPAQQIQAVSGGRVYSQHNAIVGRPGRPTPVVMAALSDINFNPYWNAPPSIIERDIIPKMSFGNTDILDKMNIKVFKGFGGPEVNPNMVNWSSAIADDYHFRQEPGPENAMATAKINFPSPFGIYLHDTPEKQLFQAGGRFFSSGCVRVDKMSVLLNWIVNGQDGYDAGRIASLAETLERIDLKLTAPPQLRVAYLTAWPAGGGVAAFRNDVYQLDGTGFVTGQPLPVGERSADGARFVLKPIPRQTAAIEADEAEGFSWFGRKFGSRKSAAVTKAPADKQAPSKIETASKPTVTRKLEAKAKSGKKEFKGLFDWASYNKSAASKTKTAKKPVKKTDTTKLADSKKASEKVKGKPSALVAEKGKPVDSKKKVVKVAAKASGETATTKPVVAADKSKPVAKPVKVAKKPAASCAAGKPEKDCKPVAELQPKKKTPVAAAN